MDASSDVVAQELMESRMRVTISWPWHHSEIKYYSTRSYCVGMESVNHGSASKSLEQRAHGSGLIFFCSM